MYFSCDGPATYDSLSVSTSAVEVKVGASPLVKRKVVTVQPVDGEVYYGYDNSVTTSTGTKIFKGQWISLEIGPDLSIYLIAASGTIDVRITEVA